MPVYFLSAGKAGPIKIGWTAEVHMRLDSLQVACPETLHIIKLVEGSRKTESDYHVRFRDLRIRGEWFRPEPALLDFIDGLTDLPGRVSLNDEGALHFARTRKLALFISKFPGGLEAFARALKTEPRVVGGWLRGRPPPTGKLREIAILSRGEVMPNDFFPELASLSATATPNAGAAA